ncbi:MAG: hypothetical protein L6Q77_07890 [Bacteroidetes bacterium]|nr:hypothetical protein [Bacteroidota bacterium]
MKRMFFLAATALTLAAGSAPAQISYLAHSETEQSALNQISKAKATRPDVNSVMKSNLLSDNTSIVESTLEIIAREKIKHPDMNFKSLAGVIDQLRTRGETAAMRYKAYLAGQILQYPEWYSQVLKDSGEGGDPFFVAIGQRDHARLIAYGVIK